MSTPSTSVSELITAIQSYSVDEVSAILKKGADLEERTEHDRTPLLIAAEAAKTLASDLYWEDSADNSDNDSAETSKKREKREKINAIITLLLDNGANINHQDEYGYTALNLSTQYHKGNPTLCPLLLQRGADINLCKPRQCFTPLMNAINFYQFDLALLLIDQGADVNYMGSNYSAKYEQSNALMEMIKACDLKLDDLRLKVMEALLKAKADPNKPDHKGQNSLFSVLNIIDMQTTNKLLAMLLEHGANVQQRDKFGKTPIIMALKYGKNSSLKMMLKTIDSIAPANENEDSLFVTVAKWGNTMALQTLYDLGIIDTKLMAETFTRLGKIEGSLLTTKVFGHSREYYFEHDEYTRNSIVETTQWFLKYLDSNFLLDNLKIRKQEIQIMYSLLSRLDESTSQLFLKIRHLVMNTVKQELMQRSEVQLHQPKVNEPLLFLKSAKILAPFVALVAHNTDSSPGDAISFILQKDIQEKASCLLPYWTLAKRSPEFSGFKFCALNSALKTKIMEFLEEGPLYVAMKPAYFKLITERLHWAENRVAERENTRKQKQLTVKGA